MNNLTVSIVSFNTKDLLKKILTTLSDGKVKNIIVLDNASSDGSVEMIKNDFPKIKLLESKDNLGFAKGHNRILKEIDTEYVLVLNPDTDFKMVDLSEMVKFMDEHPDCGISSCKIIYPDGSIQANGGDIPFGLPLFSWLFNLESFGIKKNFHRVDEDYYQEQRKVGWVGGTFMFIRMEALKKIKGFNEDYFMYFEDSELCMDIKKEGYEVWLNPKVTISHISGASSKDNPTFRQWRGEFWGVKHFYHKRYGILGLLYISILIYLSVVLRMVAFLLIGKSKVALNYFKILYSI